MGAWGEGVPAMRCSIVLAAALLVAGCASSGPTGSEILTSSLKSNAARLVIYRTSPFGFAVQPNYTVNGLEVGASTPNGFIVCELKPGRHAVAVNNAALNVNLSGGTDKVSLDMAAGTTTYLLAEPQLGLTVGVITLSQVPESQGRSDTASLHKLDSNCQKA